MGCQESGGVQQREVPSSAPGEKQPHALEQHWKPSGWKRAWQKKDLGVLLNDKMNKSATNVSICLRLHQEIIPHRKSDYSSLLSTGGGQISNAVFSSGLNSTRKMWTWNESRERPWRRLRDWKIDHAESAGIVHPGEDLEGRKPIRYFLSKRSIPLNQGHTLKPAHEGISKTLTIWKVFQK